MAIVIVNAAVMMLTVAAAATATVTVCVPTFSIHAIVLLLIKWNGAVWRRRG